MTGHAPDVRVNEAGGRGTAQATCKACDWTGPVHPWSSRPGELSRGGAVRAADRNGAEHWRTTPALADDAPAEHVATLVARSPGRVVSMICSCGQSIVGDLVPFAGVTRLMLEHLNGGRLNATLRRQLGLDGLYDTATDRMRQAND